MGVGRAVLMVAAGAVLVVPAAPADGRFAVGPTEVDLTIARGDAGSGKIDVRLTGEQGVRFRVVPRSVTVGADGTASYDKPGDPRVSSAAWITPRPARFAARPDRRQRVAFDVRVPRNAEPGDHVASLGIERVGSPARGGPAPVDVISVRVIVHVPGRRLERAVLEDLRTPQVASGGPVRAAVTVRNAGNVLLDLGRRHPGALSVGDERVRFRGRVFPGERRTFRVAAIDVPPAGSVSVRARVAGAGAPNLSEKVWIMPWREAAITVLLVAAGAILVRWRRRGTRA